MTKKSRFVSAAIALATLAVGMGAYSLIVALQGAVM